MKQTAKCVFWCSRVPCCLSRKQFDNHAKSFVLASCSLISAQWKWKKEIHKYLDICRAIPLKYIMPTKSGALWQECDSKFKAPRKAESDWHTENLCCSKGWIVLNSKFKTSAVLTGKFFFRRRQQLFKQLNFFFFFEWIAPAIQMSFLSHDTDKQQVNDFNPFEQIPVGVCFRVSSRS